MAAKGGFWAKVPAGPRTGKMQFVPGQGTEGRAKLRGDLYKRRRSLDESDEWLSGVLRDPTRERAVRDDIAAAKRESAKDAAKPVAPKRRRMKGEGVGARRIDPQRLLAALQ